MKASVRFARGLAATALAVSCAVGIACGQTIVPVKEPDACKLQIVDMSILAGPKINPTDRGEGRPVQTRVYQLASDIKLNNVDFMDVYTDDKKALGEDIVKVQEFPSFPDSRQDIRFERDEKALYVAVVSLFRSPKGRSWYTLFELPPAPGKGNCYLKVCKNGDCKDAGPQLNPHYVVWIDGTRVDSGEDHLEDYPVAGRFQQVLSPLPAESGLGIPGARPVATASGRLGQAGPPTGPRKPITSAADEQGGAEEGKE